MSHELSATAETKIIGQTITETDGSLIKLSDGTTIALTVEQIEHLNYTYAEGGQQG